MLVGRLYRSREGTLFMIESARTEMQWTNSGWKKDVVQGYHATKICEDDDTKGKHFFNKDGRRHTKKRKLHRFDLIEKLSMEESTKLHPELFI